MISEKISTLVLIRHGRSLRNVYETAGPFYENNEQRRKVGISQDRLIPLVEEGWEQARGAGKGIRELFGVPNYLFNSGFVRTKQTTEGILEAYSAEELKSLTIIESHLIRERNPGYLWNFTVAEVEKFFPWWEEYWRKADPFITFPLGGESMASICEGRLAAFLRNLDGELAYVPGGSKVFVVSHGRAILGMRYLLENWNYERIHSALRNENPPNCSVTWYQFDNSGKAELQFANKVFY
ncbi:MAG: histidine phosphatase family protein [Candidatus Harrisonbacteria bacterium]|nr:histidine phosphatase family protein [Candidatus Harrisonbacteria bacterium]